MIVIRRNSALRIAYGASLLAMALAVLFSSARAQIPEPLDAPKPLPPEESVKRFQVPEGFNLELVAAEPLVRGPSGMCWDAHGRLFVCELHGYNIDGALDIEELNKTGKLDHEVRRVRVSAEIEAQAKKLMYGTIKMLTDTDGDGRMDKSQVFADHLPPCYGICPARDGVIVTCSPDIKFLADRDGDGKAEVQEVLFTGFPTGPLERAINCPQWGLDDWIYVGRGPTGGTITGPHLAQPVDLPRTDFRIKADGSAIEPILGATNTIGFAFTESGERFTIWTYTPGIYIAPIPWRYLARNPDFAPGRLEDRIGDGRTYPASQPHPWRVRRAQDPGFAEFYTKRNGIKETAPNGYFTSACSPLVYQSDALPGLQGQLFSCEPAQNMIHRALINGSSPELRLDRAPGEEHSEFLASTDQWFNPISLAHAPDGSIAIADFYREIIEDYSAIPRYLQQQYSLKNGNDHGRVWRLVHKSMPQSPSSDMSKLTPTQWVDELASGNYWRRQTAKRLLCERGKTDVAPQIAKLIQHNGKPATVIAALYTLESLGKLDPQIVSAAIASSDPAIRVHGLRLAEPWLDDQPQLLEQVLKLTSDSSDAVALQLALSLGESHRPESLTELADLARVRGEIRWMEVAIVSSLNGRAGQMLELLLSDEVNLGQARELLPSLSAAVASRRDPDEISALIQRLSAVKDRNVLLACLQGLKSRAASRRIAMTAAAADSLRQMADSNDRKVAGLAQYLARRFGVESTATRNERIEAALKQIADIQLPLDERLAAISDVENEDAPEVTRGLLAAVPDSTPAVRSALLEAVFARQDRLAEVIAALEAKTLSPSIFSAIQKSALVEHPDSDLRSRAQKLFAASTEDNAELFERFAAALKNRRNLEHGREMFTKNCGVCHQAHGIGSEVGPNLTAEVKRAEETMIQDILTPSSSITAGYATYIVTTTGGQVITGLLASESATGITLKQQEGKSQTILRKDIDVLKSSPASLMPDSLAKTLQPQDVADILAWLKNGSSTADKPHE